MSAYRTEVKKFRKAAEVHEGDTGSVEVQVAVLTADINELNAHMSEHKHDFHSQRGLMKKIGHRRNLLRYLRDNDVQRYRELIPCIGFLLASS
ncbi:30S ribosomal protein S15 [Weissella confusa]|uniref:Small ribosomal subunit protein uS15 n=1 Tax=Weissella confusa TaxID=1583 RepID=A0A923SQD1_WEICO|nr:30S ribosomal protein S15 [Weissella confusa]